MSRVKEAKAKSAAEDQLMRRKEVLRVQQGQGKEGYLGLKHGRKGGLKHDSESREVHF